MGLRSHHERLASCHWAAVDASGSCAGFEKPCALFTNFDPSKFSSLISRSRVGFVHPAAVDLLERIVEVLGDVPPRIMRAHLREVADIADMIALAVLVHV